MSKQKRKLYVKRKGLRRGKDRRKQNSSRTLQRIHSLGIQSLDSWAVLCGLSIGTIVLKREEFSLERLVLVPLLRLCQVRCIRVSWVSKTVLPVNWSISSAALFAMHKIHFTTLRLDNKQSCSMLCVQGTMIQSRRLTHTNSWT
jgi:hypothetical protein